ncbi:MAG: fused response regulator/phosphatase [Deltaproteobacteria bacterium]|nr:fused response regulator/phosphatase [Deltaproteobacteria bacterium]
MTLGPTRNTTGSTAPLVRPRDVLDARILVVDDVEANVRLLKRLLLNARYTRIDTTVDPCEVFDLHRKHQYDLILLDLDMPRLSGFEVMESLKALDPEGHLPVVALVAEPSEKLRAMRAGARDFVNKPFDVTEVLARVAILLENRMPELEKRQRHQGLERDLAVAAEIYRALLPSSLPGCPGYELAAVSRPADDTSGDVYDVIARPDGGLIVLVADATGHGIGPALSATQLRSMVRMALRLGASIDRIVAEADRQLAADLPPDRFVTAFLGELDPIAHTLEYIAPGQGPLLHWHAGPAWAEWRNASGPPFGVAVMPFERPPPMKLEVGDIIVLATDGVFERTNAAGALFGESGVESVLRQAGESSAQAIGQLLQTRTDQYAGMRPPEDDATIVILKRTA